MPPQPRTLDDEERSTVPADSGLRAARRGVWGRRAILLVAAAIVVAGVTNQLGVRTDTVSGVDGDLEVELAYADRARAGLAVRWDLTIRRRGGFEDPIEVRTDGAYLVALDLNAIHPEPAEHASEGEMVVWEFDPPDGDELVVRLDARIEPSRQSPSEGTTIVETAGERVELRYRTWIAP